MTTMFQETQCYNFRVMGKKNMVTGGERQPRLQILTRRVHMLVPIV